MPSTSITDYSAAEISQLLESFSSSAAAKLLAAAPPEAKAAAAAKLLNVRNTSRLQARVAELEQHLEQRDQQIKHIVKSESELLDRTAVRFERLCTMNNQLTSQLNDLTRKYKDAVLRLVSFELRRATVALGGTCDE